MRKTVTLLLIVATILVAAVSRAEDRDKVLGAMRQELERSRNIAFDSFEKPYFVSYQLLSSHRETISARFGALFNDSGRDQRTIYVEVRVGNYQKDSSGKGGYRFSFDPDVDFDDSERQYFGPQEDDVDALRGQFWLATDQAYKNALSQYLSKQGRRVYKAELQKSESFNDFSHERPSVHRGPVSELAIDKESWSAFLKDLSNELKNEKEIVESEVRVSTETETRYYLNTEGSLIVDDLTLFSFYAWGRTFADDGMELSHAVVRYTMNAKAIPTFDDLRAAIRQMIRELEALRLAPVIDPYSGPAILDAQTTGTFFHEAIGHRLEGERMRDTQEGQTFKGKVGQEILPSFISISDDPTVERTVGVDLNGHYLYDSEGVPARRVELVDHGVLKNFLLSRAPIPGFEQSNGHGRSNGMFDPMARMANLFVESTKAVSHEQLKKMLIDEVKKQGKPYGLILKRSQGGETATERLNFQAFANKPTLIYKVDPETGEETLVRGAELVGTPLISISKIIATDDQPGVFNGFCGAESGDVPVSAIAPASLVSEIELQRSSSQLKRPPILPAPWAK